MRVQDAPAVGDRPIYSCVADADPALYHQVMVWAWTAIELAGIEPGQLVVHGVEGCDPRLRESLEALGVRWVPVRRFGFGTPKCNKLVQLESPALLDRDRVALTDCDLAWCAALDPCDFARVPRAKVVDLPNPPLELLRPLFEEAGFGDAATSAVSIGGALTFHSNCNGGLFLLTGDWLRRLREPWPRWVRWVSERAARLGPYAGHVFQISFALAMEELGARVEHLPLEYNYPTQTRRAPLAPAAPLRALHFHRAFDPDTGRLAPTGTAAVDVQIERVNDLLAARARDAWWLPETIVARGVHGTFRTRRDDHVTRQLARFGAHTRNELAMLLRFLRPADQVIDVGAHIGTFAVPFARAVGPSGRVIAIEASGGPFALLSENAVRNGLADTLRTVHAIATDRPGAYRAVEVPADHTSAAYYLPAPGEAPSACVRLDDLASSLDPTRPLRLLKIDVEGMELAVLRSADRLIRTHRPILYVEVVAAQLARQATEVAELERFLTARDYVFFRNVGPRNSADDEYRIARLASLAAGGEFFDCLAVPAERVEEEGALRVACGADGSRRAATRLRRFLRLWAAPAVRRRPTTA